MPDRLGDEVRVSHVIDAIEVINAYTTKTDFDGFKENTMMQDACIRQLGIIGEACNRISEELKETNPSVAWRQIVGLRNIVIHEYFGIDEQIVWSVIRHDLPVLHKQMKSILEHIKE